MRKIKLTQNKYALVDNEDYSLLSRFKWHAFQAQWGKKKYPTWYARNSRGLYMHRIVMGDPQGLSIDHINGDGLDNRKNNLQVCTHSQNLMKKRMQSNNTSGIRGVYWHKAAEKWCVEVWKDRKKHYFGLYEDIKEAEKVYKTEAVRLHGEFAII